MTQSQTAARTQSFIQTKRFRQILAATILVFTILFIMQVTVASTAGFTMRELEQDIEELKMEQKRLDIKVADLRSVESVTKRVKMMGLVDAEKITYVVSDTAVAVGN